MRPPGRCATIGFYSAKGGGSIATEKEGIAGDVAPVGTSVSRVARNGGVEADLARTEVSGAGILVIAIGIAVAFVGADAIAAGADFVSAAIIVHNTIGQALPVVASLLPVAIFSRKALGDAHPVDANRPGVALGVTHAFNAISVVAEFVGVAFIIRIARIAAPVDTGSCGRTILVAVACLEYSYARAIDAGFVDIANYLRTRIDGITAVCEDRRNATQEDTNPK